MTKQLLQTTIEKFSHDGRGIARVDGKTTFIEGALPDEVIKFQYTRKKSDFDEGRVVNLIKPSPHRVLPDCPHYNFCGGCSLQHLDATAQIQIKQQLLIDALERIGHVMPETLLPPLMSETWHYRNKARLSVRYVEKKQATLIGFREKYNPRYITDINQCLVLNRRVDREILSLRALLDEMHDPRCIAQIEVAAGDEEIGLIFRNMSALTLEDEQKIRQFAQRTGFKIYLQPHGVDSVVLFYPEFETSFLRYTLPKHGIVLQFHPTDFTQVNAHLNRQMVDQAIELLELTPEDIVLDLFCGLGNFSLPIAKYCAKVIGVEGSEAMVRRAGMNAQENGLTNTSFHCANLEDSSALLPFQQESIRKVVFDPPRTGALVQVQQIDTINPERIVYVSCHPVTFARDAGVLVQQGYRFLAAGVMDMFPHTSHVEAMGVFVKG